ncbi:MAG TPA: hypothetical protein VHL98_02295 [Microvirga sp.]|nr:hypothetical protein [Microvirga sp.]
MFQTESSTILRERNGSDPKISRLNISAATARDVLAHGDWKRRGKIVKAELILAECLEDIAVDLEAWAESFNPALEGAKPSLTVARSPTLELTQQVSAGDRTDARSSYDVADAISWDLRDVAKLLRTIQRTLDLNEEAPENFRLAVKRRRKGKPSAHPITARVEEEWINMMVQAAQKRSGKLEAAVHELCTEYGFSRAKVMRALESHKLRNLPD